MIPNIDDLKRAHQRLIVQYINIIQEISNLPFFIDTPAIPLIQEMSPPKSKKTKSVFKTHPSKKSPGSWVLRPLVKILVESHIKGKLDELRSSYMLLGLSMKNKEISNKYRKWLLESAEECAQFADILPLWRYARWLIGILFPLGVSLLFLNVGDYQTALSRFAMVIIALIFLYIPIFIAFSYKRNRFLYGSIRPMWHSWYSIPEEFKTNIYQIEDELFNLIGKKKNYESPLDVYYTIFFLLYFILYVLTIEGHILIRMVNFIFFLLLLIYLLKIANKRKWR